MDLNALLLIENKVGKLNTKQKEERTQNIKRLRRRRPCYYFA
jgi:hypothetical protein